MRLFKKHRTSDFTENAFAVRVSQFFEARQQRLAGYLFRKTQHWNRNSKIVALMLFCLLFGVCCFWLILKAML
jgi:hypothetical protein